MELYQVSSGELDGWIAAHLQPSDEFLQNVEAAVQRLCEYLRRNYTVDARVIKLVKVSLPGERARRGLTASQKEGVPRQLHGGIERLRPRHTIYYFPY